LRYVISNNHPARLIVCSLILLIPFGFVAIQQIAQRMGARRLAGLTVLLIFIGLNIMANARQIGAYIQEPGEDIALIGLHIGGLRNQGSLGPADTILVETKVWDYLKIQLASQTPDQVLFDRQPRIKVFPDGSRGFDDLTNPSVFAQPPGELQRWLEDRNTRLVIAYTDATIAKLRPLGQETLVAGIFHVFLLDDPQTSPIK